MTKKCGVCGRPLWPSSREQIAEMEKRMVAMTEVIAAAEERGRRRGLEERDRLVTALLTVANWELPPSERTWTDGTPMSYGAAFGSNGERDFMRDVARRALAPRDSGKDG